MPLESATYIAQLVATNPITTDEISQGDDHLRLIKSTLQTQFPNLGTTVAVTGTATELNAATTAMATPGTFEVANNGTVAGGEMILDGIAHTGTQVADAGKIEFLNAGTADGPGLLEVLIQSAGTAGTYAVAASLTQPGALTATASINAPSILKAGNELLPAGVIAMWSGSVASIPAGWHLCDGTSGTPDLRGMFVIGAGGSYAPAQTGGAASVTPTTSTAGAHTHGGTQAGGAHTPSGTTDSQGSHSHGAATGGYTLQLADMPAHDHGLGGRNVVTDASLTGGATGQFVGSGPFPVGEFTFNSQGGSNAHSHGISTDGAHSHNLTMNAVPDHTHAISSDGSHTHTVTVATLPPFYALAFIQKL